ncbi:hypothetical protein [Paenibacillus sedimenti]|uniref:Uncharacterized protein n=1 Tax=Paenibacillus sedimenti TaxID=2770274 RepID=A0A926KN25_9BACL|nr:hypothetical protein [Paenibacillus sedimenti]MBD0379154.1 hypothetical protein [Paenibacillus sedimenti]
MESKIGLLMDLPDDKVPGFYAQIVKALAGKVQLFDRDKEMLIVSDEDQRQAALEIMAHYKIETEIMPLRLLPEEAELTDLFSDYGFISRADHPFFYEKLIRTFRIVKTSDQAEVEQALLQMEEHLLARYTEKGQNIFVVDRQLEELMHGIAKAYKCQIEVLV